LNDGFIACYGFAESNVIQKNIIQNIVLSELFELGEEAPNEEFLKKAVHKMYFELDKDLDNLEKVINKLVEDI
jgi:hypothetical protein